MDEDKVTMSQEAWESVNAERLERLFSVIRTALVEKKLIGIQQTMGTSVVERKETPEGIQATIHPRQEITFSVRTGAIVLMAKDAEELLKKIEEARL